MSKEVDLLSQVAVRALERKHRLAPQIHLRAPGLAAQADGSYRGKHLQEGASMQN